MHKRLGKISSTSQCQFASCSSTNEDGPSRRGGRISSSLKRWPHIELTEEVAAYRAHRRGGRISSLPKRWPYIELTEEVAAYRGYRELTFFVACCPTNSSKAPSIGRDWPSPRPCRNLWAFHRNRTSKVLAVLQFS
jgi:hypothetical protein